MNPFAALLSEQAREAGEGNKSLELHAIAVDRIGDIYLTGTSSLVDPGASSGGDPFQHDVFVAKIDQAATNVLYLTYLGGSAEDQGNGIAVDGNGAAHVTGSTSSADFPTTEGAFDRTFDDTEAFVAKLSPDGTSIDFSTFVGGSGFDSANAIVVRPNGAIYVVGITGSFDFPTTVGAYDVTRGAGGDSFVVKLSPTGSRIVRSTLFGGDLGDNAVDLSVDRTGVTIAGTLCCGSGGDEEYGPPRDVFVAKLNKRLTSLVFSREFPTPEVDVAAAVATDVNGAVFVTGYTLSRQFPTTPGAFDTSFNFDADAFVVKLSSDGSTIIYATFLGGRLDEAPTAIAVDATGAAVVVGWTFSTDFPVSPDAIDMVKDGDTDAFLAVLSPDGSALSYGTFLGGSSGESGYAVGLGQSGGICVTGASSSPEFPVVDFGTSVVSRVFVQWIRP